MKKGEVQIVSELIVDLILLLFIVLIFFGAVLKVKDNKLHNLRVETREYAFTIDILNAGQQYNLNYHYIPNENITVTLQESNCLIQAKYKSGDILPSGFYCGLDKASKLKSQNIKEKINLKNE